MRIPFSEQRYPDAARRNAFLQEVLRRIAAVPGVAAVGINAGLPPVYIVGFSGDRRPAHRSRTTSRCCCSRRTRDYPEVMGLAHDAGAVLHRAGGQRAARIAPW